MSKQAEDAQRGTNLQSYDEAITGENAKGWSDVNKRELDALHHNETWELVPLPEGRRTIKTKWVFRTKYKADGSLDKLKARLVVKGYSQKAGENYPKTFPLW